MSLHLHEDVAAVQRRTLRALFLSQVLGGIGVGTAAGVASLLVAETSGSDALAGLAGTASTLGGALAAYPMAATMARRGRRPGLAVGYLVGIAGAVVVVWGASIGSVPVVLSAMLAFGAANATNLQARYAATDLALPEHRGRSLAVVVWATTVGAVLGPNLLAPSAGLGRGLGLPALAGPFVLSGLAFALAAVTLLTGLRPDPLLVRAESRGTAVVAEPERRLVGSLRSIAGHRLALVGLVGMVVGQISMTAVMAMTPVHMRHTSAMGALDLIGLVISVHIAGMYALSPLVGWAADRFGTLRVLALGPVLLWLSAAFSGLAPDDAPVRLGVGLVLLGLGWSVCLVAGSSLLSGAMPEEVRAHAQGAADLTMGLLGAVGGAASGVVQDRFGFADLNLVSAVLVLVGVVCGGVLLRGQRGVRVSA